MRSISTKQAKVDFTVLFLITIAFAAVTIAQDETLGFRDGESETFRIDAGAVGSEAGAGNSSTYNVTIHGNQQPYGVGNSTGFNVSLGYLYVLDNSLGVAPSIILNAPLNDSRFGDAFRLRGILLNISSTDPDGSLVDVYLWGANDTVQLHAGNNSLLAAFQDVNATPEGFNATYNWTSPIITPHTFRNQTHGPVLILHFDNRSELGENDSLVYDFSGNENNGTCVLASNECPSYNSTESMFGGAMNFDGVNDYFDRVDTLSPGVGIGPFTLTAWVYPDDLSGAHSTWGMGIMASMQSHAVGNWMLSVSDNGEVKFFNWRSSGEDTDGRHDTQTGVVVDRVWQHIVATYDGSDHRIFVNGVERSTSTATTAHSWGTVESIGRHYVTAAYYWDGLIDEVAIFNRSLSDEEVRNLYSLQSSKYYWKANVTEVEEGFHAESETRLFELNTFKPRINTSVNSTAPRINYTINVSANITDNFNLSRCQFVTNHTSHVEYFNQSITGTNTQCSQVFFIEKPRGNVLNFTVIAFDSANNTNQSEHLIEVANTPPPRAVALLPRTNNVTTNKTPTFTWVNITDADNDTLTFNLEIRCVVCSVDNRNLNITSNNYTLVTPLEFLNDDGYFYNWTVRANDGLTYGETSNASNLTINSLVSITMPNNSIDFGSIRLGQENSTHNNTPKPFTVENDGNVHVNITIRANQSIWLSEGIPNESFQYKVDNLTGEEFSFIYEHENSTINWTNISTDERLSIVNLSWHDANDSAEIDIKVVVPLDESSGERSAKVILEASY